MTPEQRKFIYNCIAQWPLHRLPADTLGLPRADCENLCSVSGGMVEAMQMASALDLSPAVMAVVHELLSEEAL